MSDIFFGFSWFWKKIIIVDKYYHCSNEILQLQVFKKAFEQILIIIGLVKLLIIIFDFFFIVIKSIES